MKVLILNRPSRSLNLITKSIFERSVQLPRNREGQGESERFAAFLAATSERDPAIHKKREK